MNLEEVKMLFFCKELIMIENICVVMIENFDYNGCGGIYLKCIGEVGFI